MSAPLPPDEPARLAALRAYGILDTEGERVYDDITALASQICDAPIALISFVDGERQWFKSRVGLSERETPREHAFCAYALLNSSDVLIVPDARGDDRFIDSPLVTGDPHVRFYAGAPLVTADGQALGTVCVIDRRPRELAPAQIAALRALARLVMAQLDLRRALETSTELTARQRSSEEALRAAMEARAAAQAGQDATELRMRLLVDTALDAVVMIDQAARVTFWNAQAEATFGWPATAAIGLPLTELIIPPRLREAHVAGMQRYLATGEARVLNRRIEVPAQDRDGREFPIELSISPIREKGSLKFSAFLRDISERKRSEQLLATQYQVSQALASSSAVVDAVPRVLGAICRSLGWDIGALWRFDADSLGLKCADLWLAPDLEARDFAARTLSTMFQSGEGLPGRVLAGGEPIWIPDVTIDSNFPRATAARHAGLRTGVALPIMAQSRVEGVIELFSRKQTPLDREVMNTISSVASQFGQFIERKQAEEAARQSEARMRAVIDNMLEGLMIVGADLRVLEANDAFARIFGFDRQELSGMPINRLLPDRPENQDRDRLAERYRRLLGRVTEHEGRRRNGEIFPVELQIYKVAAPEGDLFAANVRDLSQERNSDRLKEQFVASVSHELRTPLTAIRGALGLLLAEVTGPLPDATRDMIAMAERNAVRLVGIIDDLLDFERLQLGLLPLVSAAFPLERAIDRAIESVAAMAREASITVVATPASVSVFADEARVIQVLVNLLSNAVKFSPPGSLVEVLVAEDDTFAEVCVRDYGRGVPAPLREAIFEPFRQVEGSDARRHRGAGLGLAICRSIVGQHGGEINVECPADGGSIFWFTLPRHEPGITRKAAARPPVL